MGVTISDIAKHVGVDKSTVSLVLNRKKGAIRISKATREKVLQAVEELNYRPSFSARSLARGKTFSIGFMCGNIQSPHYSELAALALREAESRGYHLLISVTEWKGVENDRAVLETLLNRGVDGVIFFGIALQPGVRLYERIVAERFPLVTISDDVTGLASVVSDWNPGMREAVEHLKVKGYRKIGYARSRMMAEGVDPKVSAFYDACRDLGVEPVEYGIGSTPEQGRQDGREFARLADRVRAIIIASDQTATGFIRGVRDEGLDVPRDLSVIGIDGTDLGQYLHPPLTSIAQDREQIAKQAIEIVIGMIEKKDEPARKVHLPTRLIVRESVQEASE